MLERMLDAVAACHAAAARRRWDDPELSADDDIPLDFLVDALVLEAVAGPLEVVEGERFVLRVIRAGEPDVTFRAPIPLRTLCARIAVRIGEENGVVAPLYGGRGTLRAPDATTIDVETSNDLRFGIWIRMSPRSR